MCNARINALNIDLFPAAFFPTEMTNAHGLHIDVHDGEIVVTLPHTHFAVKYSKLGDTNDLQLIAKH